MPRKATPKKDRSGYNGWKNHATWNVALWISNDEGLYEIAVSIANGFPANAYKAFVEEMRELGITETPDHVAYNDSAIDVDALNADLFTEI